MAEKASTILAHSSSLVNNTFSLHKTEDAIRMTMWNSYNYLDTVQEGYVDIHRETFANDDFHYTKDGRLALSVHKDFISDSKRKSYRLSTYFNTELSLETISSNPKLFTYIPFIQIEDEDGDRKYKFDISVKTCIDGTTEIIFNNIYSNQKFLESDMIINVMLIPNARYSEGDINSTLFKRGNNKITDGMYSLGIPLADSKDDEVPVLMIVHDTSLTSDYEGEEMFLGTGISGEITFPSHNRLDLYLNQVENFTAHIIVLHGFKQASYNKYGECYAGDGYEGEPIGRRRDNDRQSAIVSISSVSDVDNETAVSDAEALKDTVYNMPISTNSLLVFKRKISHGDDNRFLTLDVDRVVTRHYPNIYEINASDLSDDEYFFVVLYKSYEGNNILGYRNDLKYPYKFLTSIISTIHPYQDVALRYLLYGMTTWKNSNQNTLSLTDDNCIPENINDYIDYFFKIYNYTEPYYDYDIADFRSNELPYDVEYKVNKFNDFIEKDPLALQRYAESVTPEGTTYELYVENVDLEHRKRINTYPEAEGFNDPSKEYTFNKECYVFGLANEFGSTPYLRCFIDGIYMHSMFEIQIGDTYYLYFPTDAVKSDSYIEIEKFYSYMYNEPIELTGTTPVEVDLNPASGSNPTLFDIFFTDDNENIIDKNNFSIYSLLDETSFDFADNLDEHKTELLSSGVLIYDSEHDKYWIDIEKTEEVISSEEDAAPIKFLFVDKIKVAAKAGSGYEDSTVVMQITKLPFVSNNYMGYTGFPRVQLFNGRVPWSEDPSYMRTFVSGRYYPITYSLSAHGSEYFFTPSVKMEQWETLTVDITPYSYECEYHLDKIPEDFIISFNGELSLPFSLRYYDTYLNGRKLSERNIITVSADKIALNNVHSRDSLYIFRKDRDVDYFRFNSKRILPIDELLESDFLTDDQRDFLVNLIVENRNVDTTEPKIERKEEVNPEFLELYKYYHDEIVPRGVLKPNSMFESISKLEDIYPIVKERYLFGERVVLKPNIHYDAKTVYMIGKGGTDSSKSIYDTVVSVIGDETIIPLGTIIDSLAELYFRLGGIRFLIDSEGTVTAVKD